MGGREGSRVEEEQGQHGWGESKGEQGQNNVSKGESEEGRDFPTPTSSCRTFTCYL